MQENEKPQIRFESLITDAQRIEVLCVTSGPAGDATQLLWFEFSEPAKVSNDEVAVALSTLCGRAFSSVHFDFPVSVAAVDGVKAMTAADVTTAGTRWPSATPRSGLQLSFSGGFDSLAALCLMPEETKLVSMDFGTRFSRERAFFENFPTITVSTNLQELGYNKNSWAFMGSGAILVSGHVGAQHHTFGSILEAGPDNMRVAPVAARNATFPPFKAAGYLNAPYVLGLTEIGTLMVLAAYRKDQIRESLTSLASPGEEKLYRKQVLAQIVGDRLGVPIDLDLTPKPARTHFKFGQNFALDFLSFYVAKYAGESVASDLVSDIPSEVVSLAKKLELTFYERANPTLYRNFPAQLMGGLADRLAHANMPFYTESDWSEFAQVRQALAPYHPVVAT